MDLAILIIFSRTKHHYLSSFLHAIEGIYCGDEDSFPPLKDDENPSLAKLDLHKSLRDSSPGSIIVIIDFSELFDQDVSNSIVASNWMPHHLVSRKTLIQGIPLKPSLYVFNNMGRNPVW